MFRRPEAATSPQEPESVEVQGTAVNPESSSAVSGVTGWLGAHEETETEEETVQPLSIQDFLLVSLLAAAALVAMTLVVQILQSAKKRRNRYNRKR